MHTGGLLHLILSSLLLGILCTGLSRVATSNWDCKTPCKFVILVNTRSGLGPSHAPAAARSGEKHHTVGTIGGNPWPGSWQIAGRKRSYREAADANLIPLGTYWERQYLHFCQLHAFNMLVAGPGTVLTTTQSVLDWFMQVKHDPQYPFPHHLDGIATSYDTNGNFTATSFSLWAFITHKVALRYVCQR